MHRVKRRRLCRTWTSKEKVAAESAKLRIAHQADGSYGGDAGGGTGADPALCTVLLLRASLQSSMPHLMRTVPQEALATHVRTDDAVWRAVAAVLDLCQGVGEYGADMEGPDKACSTLGRQMMLPLRHGGLGLDMQ